MKEKRVCLNELPIIALIVLVWCRTVLVSYAYQSIVLITESVFLADLIKTIIYIGCLFLSLPFFLNTIEKKYIFLYGVFCLVYFFNILFDVVAKNYLVSNFVSILFVSIPTFFLGLVIQEKKYWDVMHICSIICILATLLHFIVFGFQPEIDGGNENMGQAYRILPHLLIITLYSFNNRKYYDILVCLIGFILILACGARGPCISVCFFIVSMILFFVRKKKLLIFLVLFLGIIFFFYSENIIKEIMQLFEDMHLSTRIFEHLLSKSLYDANGRDEIFTTMVTLIKKKPFFGYGIAGDRQSGVEWIAYSHNIIIELIVSYGVFIGSLCVFILLFIGINSFVRTDRRGRQMHSVLFFSGVFTLLFTSSYLVEPLFFLWLGFAVQVRKSFDDNKAKSTSYYR